MTGMDGCDIACALRAEPAFAFVPIIFITSLLAPQKPNAEFVEHGSVSVLPKPVLPREFCSSVEQILAVTGRAAPVQPHSAGLN